MQVILHPKIYSDISAIMGYYESVAGRELADGFYTELRHCIIDVAHRPESFSVRQGDIRRVNLQRFPYHILFRIVGEDVRILVVRHDQRHPAFGARRR